MDNCMNRLVCFLTLESLAAPPEADEFMAALCRPEGEFHAAYPLPIPEAVVDGT